MKLPSKELMEKLGVSYALGPYETFPWSVYDIEEGKTCSAEVRMNPDGAEIEAEIQIFYDTPPSGKASIEQILWMKIKPHLKDQWDVSDLWIRRENWGGKIYNWEEKSCNFFRACVAEIEQGRIPDIDALLEREMSEKERFSGTRGGGAGKSPKIRPEQILNMKGQGF
ncbi:MAG: hypothetical protein KDJ26_03390 [Alphaproteobacteria bacterium]|jgi:hypothetical protein|nr:hypothetical protein [Alphaproteobacteria bacterium]MCB1551026.1 hypothetical protein [Alphaproteobacteria bacterium]MCB9985848.1 hypothetical protein [Micavibrio sp.]HPQ50164.1 hypothetical protein [Alphaproteobacteria bacterium]HRK97519.1 hypothetical protein [Alphaproteobacteria bacterium]